ncbi:hypothetical protein [Streptomyces sp. CBMA123]|uniref:hypothetical protein n=1 Tax=Streptomyces sp. CBMA123 TaxID=1896313 RepID=UPI001CB7B497|nr:hypothetical protein [Streptomyces sp. CBMA123]MBD0690655.1 hypothetical protein [Streptomyces sp. CBMA123]
MDAERALPGELMAVDTPGLLRLEERAAGLGLSQRLDPAWLRSHAAPAGRHYLRAVWWHGVTHRPELPRQLRCELVLELRTGEQVLSLLDLLPEDFGQLAEVTSRDEGLPVTRLLGGGGLRSVSEFADGLQG